MEKYGFFDSIEGEDERLYTADEFAEYFRQVISTGILNGGENLQVVCTGTDMSIQIKQGYAWLEGYLYKIDTEDLGKELATADPVLDRVDRVVIRLDKQLEHRYVKAFVLKGTPAAPALTRDENIYEISLAQIRIVAGKSFIEQSEITDERLDSNVCGLANSLIKADTTEIFNQFNLFLSNFKVEKNADYSNFKAALQSEFDALKAAWGFDQSGSEQEWDTLIQAVQAAWNTWFTQAQNNYSQIAYDDNAKIIAMGGW